MDPRKKLDILKGSLESGIIDKEEYQKWEEKLEPEAKEFDKQIETKVEEFHKEEPQEEPKKSSEKTLIIAIIAIVLLLAVILAFSVFNKQQPKTLEDLHVLNLKGELKPEKAMSTRECIALSPLITCGIHSLHPQKEAKYTAWPCATRQRI